MSTLDPTRPNAALIVLAACALTVSSATLAQDEAVPAEEPVVAEAPVEEASAPADAAPAEEAAAAEAPAEPAAEAAPADVVDGTEPVTAEAPVETIAVEPVREQAAADTTVPEDPKSTKLDAIEVTGSRIRRTDYETSQPVLVVSRADIERSGLSSIGDLLQNLPQAGAALNTAFNNGGDGSVEIDLRNLGSGRVLVLVNGRRWVNGLSQLRSNSVDLNTIPISIIESIEVLKDGASAVYGSDAIAGVVNIKTRRDFQGAEARGQLQVLDDGKGVTQSYSYAIGSANDSTSSFVDVSYVNQGELLAGDRDLSALPTFGTGTSRGSGFTPFGRFLFVPTPTNGAAINGGPGDQTSPCYDLTGDVANGTLQDPTLLAPTPLPNPLVGAPITVPPLPIAAGVSVCDLTRRSSTGDYVRFDQNIDSFNFAPVNYLLTPSERFGIFGQMTHRFENEITFSSEVLYNLRKSAQQLAQTPLGVGDLLPAPFRLAYVDSTNPFNFTNPESPYYIPGTTSQDIGNSTGGQGLVEAGAILRRMVELGPRAFSQDVQTMRIGGGFNGSFDALSMLFNWETGVAYSESQLSTTEAGLVDMSRVARALGPIDQCVATTLPDGTVVPPPPSAAGCVPLDLFGGPGTITPEMLNYISYVGHDTARQQQRLYYANFNTLIPGTDAILAAPMGLAFGAEVRREDFRSQPDPLKVNGTSSTNASSATRGGYKATEAYVELSAPLLKDLPLVEALNLSAAARSSDFGELGDNVSTKFGIEWRVYEDLMLRATTSDAFRAPSVTELFLGAVTSFPEVEDPCASSEVDETSDDFNANTAANCTSDGASGNQLNAQLPTIFGGNKDLEPETADSLTAGFVFSPSFIENFDITIDWYRIRLEDFITFVGTGQIFELCYRADPENRSLCEKVERNSDGDIISIDNTATNFLALEVEGVDFNVNWTLPGEFINSLGTFKFSMDGAYVTRYEITSPTATGERQDNIVSLGTGGQGAVPRLKVNAALTYARGPMEASWSTRYVHQIIEQCDDGRQDPGAENGGGNPTPILSLEEFGLCSGPVHPKYGLINKIDATFYHDVQASWQSEEWSTKFVLGVNNVLDQDPPPVYTSFANSFDPTLHDLPGSRTVYVKFISNF